MTAPQPPAASPRPFAAAPDPRRYFPASAMEEARQRVGRSVQRGEGPVLVIGAAGLGKTMLLEVVAQQFRDQLRPVMLMAGQLCTRRALLQMLLFELDLPYREMDESELRLTLMDYLQPQDADARRILLLVDEADALPPRLLEELRSLTNISDNGELLVNLVLAGNSTLEEQFADPKLELFSQRVSARCYLSAFGREETFQYIRAQVTASGSDPQALFSDDGLEAIFAATDGVPRLVNQLGDQLMWMVDETGYAPLDGSIVQQAWSELQQLPAPWNTQQAEALGGAVEFGELPSDDCELGATALEEDGFDDEYDADFDDDLPASIPINAPQPAVEKTSLEPSDIETVDVTELLLEQLHVMDAEKIEVTEDATQNNEAAAKNPFQDDFDSEEIVLDQYSTFESLLLTEAPRVENCTDTDFAQQLQQLEAIETPGSVLRSSTTDESEEAPTTVFKNDDPGDVLVIEENDHSPTTVVTGQKFRQLFSSLETGDSSCFG